MTKPCIICVMITGSFPQKSNNPADPIALREQVENTHEAFEAGASIAHCHVRNEDGSTTSDPETFATLADGIKTHCPGFILNLSTGGSSAAGWHFRPGLEDNLRFDSNTLAPSNAALVKRVVELSDTYVRTVATAKMAQEMLGLRP